MSLYSALFAGVSGLSAEASAMAAVADNISNINTVGYKNVESQFSTLVGDGRSNSTYSAGGVASVSKSLISKQGLLQASSSATDFGIEGQGFFVTRSGTDKDSAVLLTRAGSFAPDKQGYLRNTSGLFLQGWRLDAAGGFTNTGSADSLEPIRLTDLTGTATPTTKIQLRANFQSTTTVKSTAGYTAGDMAAGTKPADFQRSMDVFDGQGGAHRLTLSVFKSAANTWTAEISAAPGDVSAPNGLLASGTIHFNDDGSLDRTAPASTPALFGPLTPSWTNGASSQPIALEFGDDKGLNGLTQFGSSSSTIGQAINGGPLGNVSSVSVDEKGVVSAIFEDGSARPVFQLPVATVPNPDGLARVNGNAFVTSGKSGAYSINTPGSLGAGTVSGFKLEASTADLAQEFTNMIRFQRAYSASSKIITTVDDMLQEVSNLKR